MPNLKDVAVAAGVSTVTASSVLSGANRVRVSEETAVRIRDTARAMNYVPRAAARGLRTGKVQAIGFIASPHEPGRWHSYWQESLRGVGDVLWNRNERLVLSLPKSEAQETELLRQMAFGRQVDGVIFQNCCQNDPRAAIMQEAGVPFVSLGGAAAAGGHAVSFDVTRFANLLGRHILRRAGALATLAAKPKFPNDQLFMDGCRLAAKVAGKSCLEWTGALLPEAEWLRAARAESAGAPLGLLLARQLLPELVARLAEAGLELERDVRVTYLSTADEVTLGPTGLEVIPLDHYTLGRRAAQALFRLVDKEPTPAGGSQHTLVLPGVAEPWLEEPVA